MAKSPALSLRQFAASSALALTFVLAVPSFAQDAPQAQTEADAAEAPAGIAEIVVTAQFRSQRLQDTPISITAIDSALLASRNQTDLSQIAAQAPNVVLNAQGGAYGSSLGASIRGIG